MVKYAHQYTYGKSLDKTYFDGITCPTCGAGRVRIQGKIQFYGRGFRCMECQNKFYVRLVKISSNDPTNPGAFKRALGRLQHNSVSAIM